MPIIRRDPTDHLTTTEVARALHVSVLTAVKLIDNGHLKGWKVPGLGQRRPRRVLRRDLVAFARQHGIPLES